MNAPVGKSLIVNSLADIVGYRKVADATGFDRA
jgi:hypothetical protein